MNYVMKTDAAALLKKERTISNKLPISSRMKNYIQGIGDSKYPDPTAPGERSEPSFAVQIAMADAGFLTNSSKRSSSIRTIRYPRIYSIRRDRTNT